MNYKVIFLFVLSITFLFKIFLNCLRIESTKRLTPKNLTDVYDEITYQKWKIYKTESIHLAFFEDIFSFLPLFLMVIFDAYPYISRLFNENIPLMILCTVSIYILIDELIRIPFSAYKDFHIEAKYGFNRTTVKTFVKDSLINLLLSFIISLLPVYFYYYIEIVLGNWVVLVSIVALMTIMILFNFLFPYFAKIFNKFTPLKDGELKTKLIALGEKCGYVFSNIYVIDASKRSTKDNAYFSGFGKTRRIVIYDTLLEKYSVDEIVAIFAHELGHAIHKDTLKSLPNLIIFSIFTVMGFYFLTKYSVVYTSFGFDNIDYGFAFIIFSGCFELINLVCGILINAISRKHEYAADKNAVILGYGDELIASLKKLAKNSFSYLSINPILQFIIGSHPTLEERINNIEKEEVNLATKNQD